MLAGPGMPELVMDARSGGRWQEGGVRREEGGGGREEGGRGGGGREEGGGIILYHKMTKLLSLDYQ